MSDKKSARLILEDGTTFTGYSFGAETATTGEVVFNTAMTGYPESLTDPSYSGQILVLHLSAGRVITAFPKKKVNTVCSKFFESDRIHVKGLVDLGLLVRIQPLECGRKPRQNGCAENGVPGHLGRSTRARLTKIIRERGVMLGKIARRRNARNRPQFDDPNLRKPRRRK